jgi:hypothetical protein
MTSTVADRRDMAKWMARIRNSKSRRTDSRGSWIPSAPPTECRREDYLAPSTTTFKSVMLPWKAPLAA